ncbi:MAG: 3-deoxy-manno-octulosonate cytidylyltransferase [Acidobacteria bacterium]|nr:3-deoxy-manno-octulosonate cytidylyltransferase [Acidobacteriota bacterium]
MHPSAPRDAAPPHANPQVSVIIPARYASTRLPGKPLADIGGQTMIERVYRRAAAAHGVSRVVVATDDDRIVGEVRAFGGEAVMTSPAHQSGTDRIAEVARQLESDLIVNAQGDEPLLAPEAIEQALAPMIADASIVMATLGASLDQERDFANPNVVKVLVDGHGFAIYFSRAAVPFRRQETALGPSVLKHIGLYVYRRPFLLALAALPRTPLEQAESLEQLRAIEHGYRIKVVHTPYQSVSVDTPEDLERVRRLAADERLT